MGLLNIPRYPMPVLHGINCNSLNLISETRHRQAYRECSNTSLCSLSCNSETAKETSTVFDFIGRNYEWHKLKELTLGAKCSSSVFTEMQPQNSEEMRRKGRKFPFPVVTNMLWTFAQQKFSAETPFTKERKASMLWLKWPSRTHHFRVGLPLITCSPCFFLCSCFWGTTRTPELHKIGFEKY